MTGAGKKRGVAVTFSTGSIWLSQEDEEFCFKSFLHSTQELASQQTPGLLELLVRDTSP